MPEPFQDATEDTFYRDPEWEDLAPADGQFPMIRHFQWDPIHDQVSHTGPTVVIHDPDRPI